MTANVDAMVRAGAEAYRAGNREEARLLLERAIELDQYNETAWLWLSAVVTSQEEQRTCLENVLVINPNNERAKQGLRSMGINPDTVVQPQQSAPAENDVFGGANPFTDFDDEDDLDDGYSVPTSSASANYSGPQVSSSDYDEWVENLNLGGNASQGPALVDDFRIDTGTSAAANDFNDPMFDTSPPVEDDYGYDDDYIDDTEYDDVDYSDKPINGVAGGLGGVGSTFEEFDGYDEFEDLVDEDVDYDDLYGEVEEFAAEEALDMETAFARIPEEIPLGRMPGTDEPRPTLGRALIGLLILLNLGALGFLGFEIIPRLFPQVLTNL